jgi:hypothetical protein
MLILIKESSHWRDKLAKNAAFIFMVPQICLSELYEKISIFMPDLVRLFYAKKHVCFGVVFLARNMIF